MAADTIFTNPLMQAVLIFGINALYLVVFEKKRPMMMHPSAWLGGKNLFHVIERGSSVASIVGSTMAILGAAAPGLVGIFGTIFAITNVSYVSYAVYAFKQDHKKSGLQVHPMGSKYDFAGMSAWDHQIKMIDETDMKPEARAQMVAELRLVKEKTMMTLEKEWAENGAGELEVRGPIEQMSGESVRLGGGEVRAWLNFLAVKERWGDAIEYLESLEEGNVKLEVAAKNDFGNALLNVAKFGEGSDAENLLGLLLANGGDVNQSLLGVTPIYAAAENNRFGVVRALLEREDIWRSASQKVKATGFTPLEIAREMGNDDVVKVLTAYLERRALADLKRRALTAATENEARRLMAELEKKTRRALEKEWMENGADEVKVKEAIEQMSGESVRLGAGEVRAWLNFLAVKERWADAVTYLESLEEGDVKLEVAAKNDFGNALHNVAKFGEGEDAVKLLGLLLANGGDGNQNMLGVTPIYVAAQYNRIGVVRALLKWDDIWRSVRRKVKVAGLTPLEIAEKMRNLGVTEELTAYLERRALAAATEREAATERVTRWLSAVDKEEAFSRQLEEKKKEEEETARTAAEVPEKAKEVEEGVVAKKKVVRLKEEGELSANEKMIRAWLRPLLKKIPADFHSDIESHFAAYDADALMELLEDGGLAKKKVKAVWQAMNEKDERGVQ